MRAFIAIEIPEPLKQSISLLQRELARETTGSGWVKPQNLHLTLKFLGDISPEQLSRVKMIAGAAAGAVPACKIKLDNIGVFPDMDKARIIWIGAERTPAELKFIAQEMENRLEGMGIKKEQRDFRAHITINRLRSPLRRPILEKTFTGIKKLLDGPGWEFDCRETLLFESVLGPGGPHYTILERFSLRTS
jgi:2'-5' RNA ligase